MRFAAPEPPPVTAKTKRERVAKPKVKIDPKLIAAARELRDRYLERVNSDPRALHSQGKYVVSRLSHADRPPAGMHPAGMLPAA